MTVEGNFVPLVFERSCQGNWIIADLVGVALKDRSNWQDFSKNLKWLKLNSFLMKTIIIQKTNQFFCFHWVESQRAMEAVFCSSGFCLAKQLDCEGFAS